jgi:hypothetical protein
MQQVVAKEGSEEASAARHKPHHDRPAVQAVERPGRRGRRLGVLQGRRAIARARRLQRQACLLEEAMLLAL